MKYRIFQSGKKLNNSRKKKFNPKDLMVYSFCFFCLALSYLADKHPELKIRNIRISKLDVDEVEEKIISSTELKEDEKEYLCNEEYLEDILPYINKSIVSRTYFNNNIDNVVIQSYGKEDVEYEVADGYYSNTNPQTIHIKDYDGLECNEDTVSHEFIHLCQIPIERNIIKEACAEIISYEYFDTTEMDAYSREVTLIKTLMEIIGPEPVWEYNFTGNFSKIENEVKPYLNEQEYEIFMKFTDYEEDQSKKSKIYMELSSLMEKIYKRKYEEEICNNEILDAIRHNKQVCRYYFNDEHINREESYYMNRELHTFNTKEAYNKGYIHFFKNYFDVISKEQAVEFLKDASFLGKVEAYKTNGFEEVSYIELVNDSTTYPFYFVKGTKPVTFEEFYENNKELALDSEYKYVGNEAYIKSIDLDGDSELYIYVKKNISPIKKVRKLVKKD